MSLDSAGAYQAYNFNFFLAETTAPFKYYDGILGMAKPVKNGYNMFIDTLYQSGVISSRVFALYLADKSVQSKMQVGGSSTAYFKSGSAAIVIQM